MYFFDVKFLSTSDEVHVKQIDFRAFKYENKKIHNNSILAKSKRSYCESRGQAWTVSSKRPGRLKENLKELEERLKEDVPLLTTWKSSSLLCILFSSGLISYLTFNTHTSELTRIFFDRHCVGKIAPNCIGAIFTDTHLVFVYTEKIITLVSFNQPTNSAGLQKISTLDPKHQTIELYGPSRKCEKHISVSTKETTEGGSEESRVLVWSVSAAGELFPWSPSVRGEDRANVHVYTLNKNQMTLLCYHRIENEALSVELSRLNHNIVYTVEQNTYEKGGLIIECSQLEIDNSSSDSGTLRVQSSSVVYVPAPVRSVCRSSCETRVLLACIDATVLIHHDRHGVTRSIKAAFIPSMVRCAEGIVTVCEERGRLQCFDVSLAPLSAHTSHEDAKFIDIGAHLKCQCTVRTLEWNSKLNSADTSPQFAVVFEGGPLAILNLTLTDIVQRWLSEGQVSRVTSLLRSLSWDSEGNTCLHILHTTIKHLFRKGLSPASELLIQEALGSYHTPAFPLSETAVAEFGAPVHDLTRKFFHHLVRHGRLDKALSLGVDLGDSDLFMDVAYAARRRGDEKLASEARQHAIDAISDHSTCSNSSCSQCTSDSGSVSSEDRPLAPHRAPKPHFQRVAPPLPSVPPPASEPPLPVPIIPQEPAPVHSIRPNLHQYLDRESTLWHDVNYTNIPHRPTHKVVDIIPRPSDEASQNYNKIYQMELKETNGTTCMWQSCQEKRPYKSVYSQKSAMANRYPQRDAALGFDRNLTGSKASLLVDSRVATSKPPEKNVKFSDTVTVAVVPEIPRKEKLVGNITLEAGPRLTDPRKELADSLPLCHPNRDYLKDFAPVPTDNEAKESQGKIKVVHFGLV